jgi:release factor-specific protein-(glutamine-N5) methyltransferase
VQYLVGRWPFFGRDFEVGPSTLIPRPCTEVLVERALDWMRERKETQPSASLDVLDLCTGTGCIAISLALGLRAIQRPEGAGCRPLRGGESHDVPRAVSLPVARDIGLESSLDSALDGQVRASDAEVFDEAASSASKFASSKLAPSRKLVATDLVADAVELARRNAERLGATIDLRVGDLYAPLRDDEHFDLIVSNPPYITDAEYEELDRNVREYEPASALKGGADGLQFVRFVVAGAEKRLRSGGLLLVEIGWKHGDAVRKLGTRAGWRDVEVLRDGDGHERVLVAHRV